MLLYKFCYRLRAAYRAFKAPDSNKEEMANLIREIYLWTDYKETSWAKKAKKFI
jgi:hypothetical protein